MLIVLFFIVVLCTALTMFTSSDTFSSPIQNELSALNYDLKLLKMLTFEQTGNARNTDAVVSLSRKLALNSVTAKLLSLKMGYEKVDYVIKLLENDPTFKEFVYRPKESKSNEQSEKLRINGNDLYKVRNYSSALKYYTNSIAFAENGSLYLAKAYGNRSAVLFEKMYYLEAIKDIERSLCCECPKQVEKKLLIRKSKAKSMLYEQKIIDFCSYFPQIQHIHPKINAASSSIEIRQNNDVGRYVVATENIKFGEVIAVEKPYVQQIRQNSKELHCNECLQPCFNLIPCQNCATTMYCSEECMQKAYNSYHKYSCEIPACEELNINLKTFLIGQSEKKDEELDDRYRSDRFQEIMKLSTNENKMNPIHLLFYTIITGQCFLSLKYRTDFFRHHTVSEKEAKNLLYTLTIIPRINLFAFGMHGTNEIYATGIFPFISLFNHSCAPNCQFFYHGDNIVVRAMKDIGKGQECHISYARCDYEMISTSERQERLFDVFQFKCRCKACEENWSVSLSKAELLRRICLIDCLVYRDKIRSDLENVQQVIKDVGPTLNSLANSQPNVEFSYLKYSLITVLQHAGNKSFFPSEF